MNDFTVMCWYWSGSLVSVIISLISSFQRKEGIITIFMSAYIMGALSWSIPIIMLCFLPQKGYGIGAWRTLP